MKDLTETQIEAIIDWMNCWDQIKGGAIPIRFRDDFTRKIPKREKPPIGLVPKFIRNQERQREIMEAIQRYLDAGIKPPEEWILEFHSYCK